ncbi:MAG TPA: hypothetical protein VG889_18070 [Rhizomicrobium sp.]|nr:hypothetical protein [Rhizomicrobium sp.]
MSQDKRHQHHEPRERQSGRGRLSATLMDGGKWAAGIVIGAVLLGLGNYVWDLIKPQPFFVSLILYDEKHDVLPGASVWLDLNEVAEKKTSDLGLVTFEVPHKYIGQTVKPVVRLSGYATPESRVNLGTGLAPQSIILRRSGEVKVALLLSPKHADLTPAPTPDPVPVTETRIYESPSQPSGRGAEFSTFYSLCSQDAPAGWTIEKSSFVLTGDRQCGAWSNCSLLTETPTKVCWQFNMQGHDEQMGFLGTGGSGIQYSKGILTVVWKHN